jgi:hypothetical protein
MATIGGLLQGGGSGPLQGGVGGAQIQSTATPASLAIHPATTPVQQAVAQGGGTTGTGINSPEYLQGIQQEYGSTISNAERQIPYYTNVMNTLQKNTNTQAGQQIGDENNSYTSNNNSYETQKSANNAQTNLSLAELADQIHGQNVGLINQLGTQGAGSSSAVGAGQSALAKVQNTDRANVEQNAGNNNAEISANQQSLLTQHKSNLDQISQYRTNQLQNILGTYVPLIQNINASMSQATGEEKARLAMYGQTITQQAGVALQKLDGDVNALSHAAVKQVSENLSKESVATAPTAVSVQQLSPFTVGNTGVANTTAAPTGGSVAALMGNYQQQNQLV